MAVTSGRGILAAVPAAVALAVLLALCRAAPVNADNAAIQPFRPGERLVYQLRWTIIPAGEAVLEVGPFASIDGIAAYRFTLTARSNAVVDVFYKVRDRIDAWIDTGMHQTLRYRKRQREGSHRRNVRLRFDPERQQVQYVNFGRARAPLAIPDGTLDPLSALYFVRTLPLRPGQVVRRPITDGKKWVTGVLHVVRRETVTVGERRYDTLLLEPELRHVGGVFEKSPGARIRVWVTADHRRIPVKVASRVVVGSFVGELVSADDGAP